VPLWLNRVAAGVPRRGWYRMFPGLNVLSTVAQVFFAGHAASARKARRAQVRRRQDRQQGAPQRVRQR